MLATETIKSIEEHRPHSRKIIGEIFDEIKDYLTQNDSLVNSVINDYKSEHFRTQEDAICSWLIRTRRYRKLDRMPRRYCILKWFPIKPTNDRSTDFLKVHNGRYKLNITEHNVKAFIGSTLGIVLIKLNRSQRHSYYHWLLSDTLADDTKVGIMKNLRLPYGSGTIGWVERLRTDGGCGDSTPGVVIFNSFLDPLGQVASEDWQSGTRAVYAIPLFSKDSVYVASLFLFSPLEGLFCKLAAKQGNEKTFTPINEIDRSVNLRKEYLFTALQLEEHDQLGCELKHELEHDTKSRSPCDEEENCVDDPEYQLLYQLRCSGTAVDDLSLFEFAIIRNDREKLISCLSANTTAWINETRRSLDEHFCKLPPLSSSSAPIVQEKITEELEKVLVENKFLGAIAKEHGGIRCPVVSKDNLYIAFICCGKAEDQLETQSADERFLNELSLAFCQLVNARDRLGNLSGGYLSGENKKLLSDAINILADCGTKLFFPGGIAEISREQLQYLLYIVRLISRMPDIGFDVRRMLVIDNDQSTQPIISEKTAESAILSLIDHLSDCQSNLSIPLVGRPSDSSIIGCAIFFISPGWAYRLDTMCDTTGAQMKEFVTFLTLTYDRSSMHAMNATVNRPMREVHPSDLSSRLVKDYVKFDENGNASTLDGKLACKWNPYMVNFLGVSFQPIALDKQIANLVAATDNVEEEMKRLAILEKSIKYECMREKIGYDRTVVAYFEKGMPSPFESVMRKFKFDHEYDRFSQAIANSSIDFDHAKTIGRSLLPLLLTGGTGAGKSFFAKKLHQWVKRYCFPINDGIPFGYEEIGCSGLDRTQFVIELHGSMSQSNLNSNTTLGAVFRLVGLQEVRCYDVPTNFVDYIKLSIRQNNAGMELMELMYDDKERYYYLRWKYLDNNNFFRSDQTPVGTIYFSGVTYLSRESQGVLLRFLDTFLLYPLGWSGRPFCIKARIISSSNDEKVLTDGDKFRNDLYQRLSVWQKNLDPISARLPQFWKIANKIISEENKRMASSHHGIITDRIPIEEALASFLDTKYIKVAPYEEVDLEKFRKQIDIGDAAYLTKVVIRAYWYAAGRSSQNIEPQDLVKAINNN